MDGLQQQVQKIDELKEQVNELTDLLNSMTAALPDTSKQAKNAPAAKRR